MEVKNNTGNSPFDLHDQAGAKNFLERMVREVCYGNGPWYGVSVHKDLHMIVMWESLEKPIPTTELGLVILQTSRGKFNYPVGRVANTRKKAYELARAWALISGRYDWSIQTH